MKNLKTVLGLMALGALIIACDPEEEIIKVDLEVSDITFTTTGIDPDMQDFAGTATITAIVTNVGDDDYVSGDQQQAIVMQESGNGTMLNFTDVANETFGNLGVGETVTVSYSRAWDISSPAEGEFAPYYKAYISKDPDIGIDGNPANDDNNSANDELVESGEQINNLF